MVSRLKTLDGLLVIEPSKNVQLHKPLLIADGLVMAEAGDGVLVCGPDGTGEIIEKRQYVFPEWDRVADNDMDALVLVIDTSGNGVLSGAELDDFRIMLRYVDESTTSRHWLRMGGEGGRY